MGDNWAKFFSLFALAFMAGIFFVSIFDSLAGTELLFVLIGLAFFLVAFLRPLEARKVYILSGFLSISMALGIARYDFVTDRPDSPLDGKVGQKTTLTGVIATEPDERDKETHLTVLLDPTSPKASSWQEKVLIVTARYPVFQYGDQIKISGKLQTPKNFSLPNGAIFDYQTYLGKNDIYYEMYLPKITLLAPGRGSWLTTRALSVKKLFLDGLAGALPEPESSYAAGLILGAKRGLGQAIQTDFQRAGLSHVLVLSGYNVTIAASSMASLLAFLPALASGSLSILFIILFGLAAGGGATVWRASVMAIIAVYAKLSGRLYSVSTALLFAATLMLAPNPRLLVFDLSFELSFLATLGVVYGAKIFHLWFARLPEWHNLKDTLCTTLGALTFVLPLILYKTGLLPVFAIPANLFVLPVVPATMALGFFTAVLHLIFGLWAAPLSYLTFLLLKLELAVVHFVAALPAAVVTVPPTPFWLVSFVYLFLVLAVATLYPRTTETI